MSEGCMLGCYPVDKMYTDEATSVPYQKLGIDREGSVEIQCFADLKRFVNEYGPAKGQAILDEAHPAGEPYVYPGRKKLAIDSSTKGLPMNSYYYAIDILDYRYDYEVHKVKEYFNISPRSDFYENMIQKRQKAEQQVNRVLSNIADLYKEKHMLEHDVRKLKERVNSFEKAKEGNDEGLKADYVDLVDVHTGRRSIEQMQVNNIFPTLVADFYMMESKDDLTGEGPLADLPESEKAVLRKKWELYERWQGEFKQAVENKLDDLQRRLRSVETSIERTEEWLRPYVRAMKDIETTEEADLDRMTSPHLVEGYSTYWRDIKIVAWKKVRSAGGKDTHYNVVVLDIQHLDIADLERPGSLGGGAEVLLYKFKEYVVCKHVLDLIFKGQVEERKNEVERFVKRYKGEELPGEEEEKEEVEEETWKDRAKKRLYHALGITDDYFVTKAEAQDLREGLCGPKHPYPLYYDLKFHANMFVMN